MKGHPTAYILATLLTTRLVTTDLHAAGPADADDCRQTRDLDRAIAACSEAIRAGPGDSQTLVRRGFAHFLKFDYDPAFADYEAAIRRNPKAADAYRYRGVILQIRGDDDRAIADFTKALDLGLKDPLLLVDRGIAYAAKGASAQSIADFSAAIQRDPNSPFAYLFRGIAYTYQGALEKAQADFKRGYEAGPKLPHFLIWLHIAERRANVTSDLASSMRELDMTKWPAPVVRMFLGEEAPSALLAYGVSNAATRPHGACEADFYVAEFMYLQKQRDEALRLYKSAQQNCRRNFAEWMAATAVLRSFDPNR
jgi:lipoprotein NlpI